MHILRSSRYRWTVFESRETAECSEVHLMPVSSSGQHMLGAASRIYKLKSPKPSPVIVMNKPSDIGLCGDLLLDARSSFGSAGRPFSLVKWQLVKGPAGLDQLLERDISSKTSLLLNIPFVADLETIQNC